MKFEDYNFIIHGRILEYFPETQTATVKISGERLFSSTSDTRTRTPRTKIENVPVHTPSGGGWALTFPIKPNDTCLLLFSQQGYDHWLWEDLDEGGSFKGNPVFWLERKFSLKDGFAHVGYNTIPRKISDYSKENSEWRGEDSSLQVIRLKPDTSIEIESSVSVTVIAPVVNVESTTTNITATAACNITSPITNVSGILNVGGALNVTGLTTGAGTMATPAIMINGKPYSGHVHMHGQDTTTPPI